jgi:hypothetical protein
MFALFPKLPMELRLKIWKMARPEGRYILLEHSRKRRRAVFSRAKVPALLHACQESRDIALKWYKLSFGTHSSFGKTYFDAEIDGLYHRCSIHGQHHCDTDGCEIVPPKHLDGQDKVKRIVTNLERAHQPFSIWKIIYNYLEAEELRVFIRNIRACSEIKVSELLENTEDNRNMEKVWNDVADSMANHLRGDWRPRKPKRIIKVTVPDYLGELVYEQKA